MCSGSEAGSYLRLIDLLIVPEREAPTHLDTPGGPGPAAFHLPEFRGAPQPVETQGLVFKAHRLYHSTLGSRVVKKKKKKHK